MSSVTVLAGGYSASLFDLAKLPGKVIAVNDAAYYAPKVDAIVSMDRLWAENRFRWLSQQRAAVYLRRCTIRNFSIADQQQFHAYECDHESVQFSSQPGTLNGRHSGSVALNLAFQWSPLRVFLVGFDMRLGPRGEKHWYPDYAWKSGGGTKPGKLAEWGSELGQAFAQFASAGIEVYHCASQPLPGSRPISSRSALLEVSCAA
jgi:hypothetical protein